MAGTPEDTILPYEWEDKDRDIIQVACGFIAIKSDGRVSTVFVPTSTEAVHLARAVLEAGDVKADILLRESKPCAKCVPEEEQPYLGLQQAYKVLHKGTQTITMPVEMQNKILDRLEYLERKVMLLGAAEDEE